MKHSESEIIKALNVIKDVCGENICDEDCPFYDRYFECVVNNKEPDRWDIIDDKIDFKAFKGAR